MLVNTKTQILCCRKVCPSQTYNKVPTNTIEVCFYCKGLSHIKKNGFSWLVVLPTPTRGLSYYKPSYWAWGSIILKGQQICQCYGKNLVLNYSDILCGKTFSVELPEGGFTVFLLTSEVMYIKIYVELIQDSDSCYTTINC